MLAEFPDVRQEAGPVHRRWFQDDLLDLIVWYDDTSALTGFQLCYKTRHDEYALTWRPASGFTHSKVDTGTNDPLHNRTPILTPAGPVPWDQVQALFRTRGEFLEPVLRRHIEACLLAKS
jgi:hypothetical protein